MLVGVVALVLSQAMIRVAVLDVSAPDAIYEDVSRGLAERVSDELLKKGFFSKRVDESELPVENCRVGPCLGVIAKARGADVLLLLDATEDDKGRVAVSLSAMRGRDGLPLAVGRWTTTSEGKPNKQLTKFLEATQKAVAKHVGEAR
ncbi:MAG: hypothetical protein JNJ54_27295 [Myxococcaceae bacterium]|nr:hypothetical protein [Myxococcaceae bacterium]